MEFEVFGKPVPKQRARTVGGHTYTPATTRQAEEAIAIVVKSQMRARGQEPLAGAVQAEFHFYGASATADIDNLSKLVQDALNGIAYDDDRQIVALLAFKHKDGAPRTTISITRAGTS